MISPPLNAAAMGRIAAVAPHALPLFRAARDGLIALLVPMRDTPAAQVAHFLDAVRRPAVVLIGDDDHASTGPAGWACARRLPWWARAVVVHAAAGAADDYECAVLGALVNGRLALIETSTAHADAWGDLFQGRAPVLSIRPRNGLPHPVLPAAVQ